MMMLLFSKNFGSNLGLVCVFGLVLVGAAGDAQAESKIAFVCKGSSGEEICVMNTDGTSVTELTNTGGVKAAPSWSPDGNQIVFITNFVEFWVVDSDGGNEQMLYDPDPGAIATTSPSPAWSPELPSSVASISPFGQFVTVFILGGITALWVTGRRPQRAEA